MAIKILIVDDEKAILSLLHRILTKFDFAVDVAESGEEGIHKILKTTYDLILTDIKMPGMSGGDLLNYVKVKVDQSLPVIAMSGTPWLFENSNFDAVIAKPFSKEELLEVMSRFVQITEP
ncbi:response regulator [Desulfopila aestuarii]|uniref:Response regulator receiver domain-containing protein n=1 Tax=Desulfopila aestuarii DSM 18488 TaxID=1121416 RepID=A0A1M7Y3V6_9BACT|nr:response regulator [Desulfopila aestuarii]SHO46755.1 Response regulator receiver domain-containing protein [Desulfopila aestuarii DSM 18488]